MSEWVRDAQQLLDQLRALCEEGDAEGAVNGIVCLSRRDLSGIVALAVSRSLRC
ncbi:MAG: hypothetical protein ACRDLL_13000 [Solirubrobacterales bacterium]